MALHGLHPEGAAGQRQRLPLLRNPPQAMEDEPGDGVVVVSGRNRRRPGLVAGRAERGVRFGDRQGAVEQVGALRGAGDLAGARRAEGVEERRRGDQPLDPAVFVHHQQHPRRALVHLQQRLRQGGGVRQELRRLEPPGHREAARAGAEGGAEIEHAEDFVGPPAGHRHPGVAVFAEQGRDPGEGGVRRDPADVAAGGHDLREPLPGGVGEAGEEALLVAFGVGSAGAQDLLHLGDAQGRLPGRPGDAEEAEQPLDDPGERRGDRAEEPEEGLDRTDQEQGPALRVAGGDALRHHLAEDEQTGGGGEGREYGGSGAFFDGFGAREERRGQEDADERVREHIAGEDRAQEPFRMRRQPADGAGAGAALRAEPVETDRHERRLRTGEEGGEDEHRGERRRERPDHPESVTRIAEGRGSGCRAAPGRSRLPGSGSSPPRCSSG